MAPHKTGNFCKANSTINWTKRQPTEWKNIFADFTFNKGLISKIYKESKKPNQTSNLIKNLDTDLNKDSQ